MFRYGNHMRFLTVKIDTSEFDNLSGVIHFRHRRFLALRVTMRFLAVIIEIY